MTSRCIHDEIPGVPLQLESTGDAAIEISPHDPEVPPGFPRQKVARFRVVGESVDMEPFGQKGGFATPDGNGGQTIFRMRGGEIEKLVIPVGTAGTQDGDRANK
jgi:hypothetical protein